MRRRGFLGALAFGLVAPSIIRTPGLLMPISTFALPYLILRAYGYDGAGNLVLQDTIRFDDFDFEAGRSRRDVRIMRGMHVWRASVETHGYRKGLDGKETSIDIGVPRDYLQGGLIGLHDLKVSALLPRSA